MANKYKGVVKWFSPSKGYGFVSYNKKDVFVHYSKIVMGGFKTLNKDDVVEFELQKTDNGLQCINVTKIEQ